MTDLYSLQREILVVSGIGTTIAKNTPWVENYGSGTINYVGIVSATTYHGNQVIGTPTNGSFRVRSIYDTANDFTKDKSMS